MSSAFKGEGEQYLSAYSSFLYGRTRTWRNLKHVYVSYMQARKQEL